MTAFRALLKFSRAVRNKMLVISELRMKSVVKSTNVTTEEGLGYVFSSIESSERIFFHSSQYNGTDGKMDFISKCCCSSNLNSDGNCLCQACA